MSDVAHGYQYLTIGTIGTVVQRAVPSILHSFTPRVSVGTVTLYDSATAAGTAASNEVFAFTGGTAHADCVPRVLDIQFKKGIVTQQLGTPIALLAVE